MARGANVRMIALMALVNTAVLTVFVGLIVAGYIPAYPASLFVGIALLVVDMGLSLLLRPRDRSQDASLGSYSAAVKVFDVLAAVCLGGAVLSLIVAISTRELTYLVSVGFGLLFALYLRHLATKVRKHSQSTDEAP